jgi:Asp/Glu/hydantoin racemase
MIARTLSTKTLQSANLPGQNITVATTQLDDNPIVYEITATIGAHAHVQRHAIGAMATGPLMTAAELQKAVDGYRQQVADAAAWQVAMSGPQAAIV